MNLPSSVASLAPRVQRRMFLARRPIRLGRARAARLEHVLGGLGDFGRVLSESAPGGRVVERGGVVAAVVPVAPDEPIINAVVYDHAEGLAAALDDLAATYENAGVRSWVVLVPAVDRDAKRLLRRSGHVRMDSASGMARVLRGFPARAGDGPEAWTAEGDPAALGAICDRVFGSGDAFARTLAGGPPERARMYVASVNGEPASCVMTSEHERNCAVDLMATIPAAKGRGLATLLLSHAMAGAAKRGCRTTTVVASPEGERVYRRLGYRNVCPIQHWVRRHAQNATSGPP